MARATYTTWVLECDEPDCDEEYESEAGEGWDEVYVSVVNRGWSSDDGGDYCPTHTVGQGERDE